MLKGYAVNQKRLEQAADLLKQGKLVAFPTETVMGLAVVFDDFLHQ